MRVTAFREYLDHSIVVETAPRLRGRTRSACISPTRWAGRWRLDLGTREALCATVYGERERLSHMARDWLFGYAVNLDGGRT